MKQHIPTPAPKILALAANIGNPEAMQMEGVKSPQIGLHGQPLAYFPYITKECFHATMNNARRYISAFNKPAKEANKAIRKHNAQVREHMKTVTDKGLIHYHNTFEALNGHLNPVEYNKRALDACAQHGPVICQKLHFTIKLQLQQTVSTLLYEYGTQLELHSKRRYKFPFKTAQPLPPIDINSQNITGIKCDKEADVYGLDVCKDTVRNHRRVLEDVGILINYKYRGSWCGVHMHFNPDILVFEDAETRKKTGTENQFFTRDLQESFADCSCNTRSLKEEEKSNPSAPACVDKVPGHTPAPNALHEHLQEPSAPLPLHEHSFTRTPPSATSEGTRTISPGAGAEPPQNPHSEALRALIQTPNDLDADLRTGTFEGYKPLDFAEFEREALGNGSLTREEFVALFVQVMFKYAAATLYNGRKDIYAGSWYNAYRHWLAKFTVPGGQFQKKDNMLRWYHEYIWRINWAKAWFERESRLKKKQLQPTPPSLYFNSHRKDKQCLGFAFTGQKWKQYLEKENPEIKLKRQAAREAQRIKSQSSNMRKFEKALAEYFAGKRTPDQLWKYVENNLPVEYQDKAVEAIKKRMEAIGFKVVNA